MKGEVEKVDEIALQILESLYRNGCLGERYKPVEKIWSGVAIEDRGDAKQVMDDLHNDDILIYHKAGDCVSINPKKQGYVEEQLTQVMEQWIIDSLNRG